MRPMMVWRTLVVCSVLVLQGAWAHQKYYVEDECVSPTEFQKIEFQVPGTGRDSVGELRPNRFGTYSRTGRKCLIKLVPPEGYGIVLTILSLDFRNKIDCKDYIKMEETGEKLCNFENLVQKSFYSDGDATILYHTSEGGIGFSRGFKIVFTVTKMAEGNDPCPNDQFGCANGRCVWQGVKCDGVDNCGDASDEIGQDVCSAMTTLTMATIILGVASFAFILLVMCLFCCKAPRTVKPMNPYTPLAGYGTITGDMLPTAPPQNYYDKPPPYSVRAQLY